LGVDDLAEPRELGTERVESVNRAPTASHRASMQRLAAAI
jgi:hypothetical protein